MSRRRTVGFTIIELMIAIVIFAVGIMALYSLQVVTISGISEARELAEASILAERVLEQFRRESTTWIEGSPPSPVPGGEAGPWTLLYAKPVDKDGLGENEIPENSPSHPPRFCIKYRMNEIPNMNNRVYRVEVRVMWPRREGKEADFAACPVDMDSVENMPFARQLTLPGTIYRHRGYQQ